MLRIQSTKKVFNNGLTLLVAPNRNVPTASIAIYCDSGILCEPESKAGLAHLVSLVIDEGSKKRSGEAVREEIESIGGDLETGPSGASVAVPSSELERGLRVLSEVLLTPAFPEKAVRSKKDLVLSEILAEEDDLQAKAQRQFKELVYGAHPLHRPSHGYERTVMKLTRRDLVDHHKKYYAPERTILAVAGEVTTAQVERLVEKYFGRWSNKAAPFPAIPPLPRFRHSRQLLIHKATKQVHIYVGHQGIRRNDPDYYKLLVMDYVLGSGPGFTDRLSKKLRDQQGLAYTVHAGIASTSGKEPGVFSAYMGTSPETLERAVKGILAELRQIVHKAPSEEEVRLAKDYLTGSYVFGVERNLSRALFLINRERYQLGDDYFQNYPKYVESVTPAQILEAARKHIFPDRYVLVAVGKVKR